jgi:hypothetical protein
MTHTRGPWTASQYLDTHEWGVITGNNEIVVGLDSRISAENATLIAAAPEILAELKEAVDRMEMVEESRADSVDRNSGFLPQCTAALDYARKAIAKAEGR